MLQLRSRPPVAIDDWHHKCLLKNAAEGGNAPVRAGSPAIPDQRFGILAQGGAETSKGEAVAKSRVTLGHGAPPIRGSAEGATAELRRLK